MDNKQLAREIIAVVGADNITQAYNCMTRLRLEVRSVNVSPQNELKKLDGVKGVIFNNNTIHVVLGPGKAENVTRMVKELLNDLRNTPSYKTSLPSAPDPDPIPLAPLSCEKAGKLHTAIRQKNRLPRSTAFLHKVGHIFIPLIPAFIGCGLLIGLLSFLLKISPELALHPLVQYLKIAGNTIFSVLNAFVGLYACREFGGTPALGGALAALLSVPDLAQVTFFDTPLIPERGGVFAALLIGAATAWTENRLRSIIPETISLFITPFITVILVSLSSLFIFQPFGGFLSDGITYYTIQFIHSGGAITGFILGGFFLPIVMTGVHHGITPIHADLLATQGATILLPIIAMAGCGQVGAAIAVYVKSRNTTLKHAILSALPVGMMGIGEPLIYGVTLPLGRPFLAACAGGALGGAWQALQGVGAYAMGISGLPLAAATNRPTYYLIGVLIAYVSGFIATYLIGFNDPEEMEIA